MGKGVGSAPWLHAVPITSASVTMIAPRIVLMEIPRSTLPSHHPTSGGAETRRGASWAGRGIDRAWSCKRADARCTCRRSARAWGTWLDTRRTALERGPERLRPVRRQLGARRRHVAHADLREVGAHDVAAVAGAQQPAVDHLPWAALAARDVLPGGPELVAGPRHAIERRLAVGVVVIEEPTLGHVEAVHPRGAAQA